MGELAGLLFAGAMKQATQRRVQLEQAVVQHKCDLFEDRFDHNEAALNDFDLLGSHFLKARPMRRGEKRVENRSLQFGLLEKLTIGPK